MKKIILALGLCLAITASANAAIHTESIDVGGSEDSIELFGPIPLFDPSLGTLTEVKYTLNGLVSGGGNFINFGNSEFVSIDINAHVSGTIDSKPLEVVAQGDASLLTFVPGGKLISLVPDIVIEPGQSNFGFSIPVTGMIATTDVSPWIGPGSELVSIGLNVPIAASFPISDSHVEGFVGVFTVDYSYTPAAVVPEPSSYITFVGLALCFGLAGWRQKRQLAAA